MGVRATTYLQIEPDWSYDATTVLGAKVVRCTQRAPKDKQLSGTVLVKITIDVPESAFLPLTPEGVVTIPDNLTIPSVEVSDPTD